MSQDTTSLLIPPNPSLSPRKPAASILLNGAGRPAPPPQPKSPPRPSTPRLPSTGTPGRSGSSGSAGNGSGAASAGSVDGSVNDHGKSGNGIIAPPSPSLSATSSTGGSTWSSVGRDPSPPGINGALGGGSVKSRTASAERGPSASSSVNGSYPYPHSSDSPFISSTSLTSSTNLTSPSSPAASLGFVPDPHHPARRGSQPKITFAPLPSRPPEFRRRNSITLGVASRSHLIGGQQGGTQGGQAVHKVYMTDEDWEAYKKQYEQNRGTEVLDVGQLCKTGAKAIWRSVKRGRSGSASSQTSQASTPSQASGLTTQSAPVDANGPPQIRRVTSAPTSQVDATVTAPGVAPGGGVPSLGTVEEEHDEPALGTEGRQIPGRLGSPPPRHSSISSESGESSSSGALGSSLSETESPSDLVIDPTATASGDPSPASPTDSFGPWSRRTPHHSPTASRHPHPYPHQPNPNTHSHTHAMLRAHGLEDSDGGADGEATPRRRPSPPPRIEDKLPTADEVIESGETGPAAGGYAADADADAEPAHANGSREAYRDDGYDSEPEEEGRKTPPAWQGHETHQERMRGRRSAVLGFDEERFGLALNMHDGRR
ncbi:hypothetical protein IAT38_001019 [Cryptococcus sp. DSM 104549]